ncbi:hypothetical protein C8255_13040 [filamentous cyanobacterium CCP3]|nr:hypothetical protein C8255_13040 [filamentous cyanobacterium CCP3]
MAEQQFDVFLAHSSKDKPLIRRIYRKLTELGIRPWLDEEEIAPGTNFQDEIQQAIGRIKTAAIFLGQGGLGRWQALELKAFINQCIRRDIPIIPVLLPGVEDVPPELIFLQEFHAVLFQDGIEDENALFSLEWGITGQKPTRKPKNLPPVIIEPHPVKVLIRCDPQKILFIKNVKNPVGEWAYQQDRLKPNQEPIFELMWRLGAHGVNLPGGGDLMILHQRAKVTHLVEFLDEQIRETDSGYFRRVKVIWMPTQQDWYKLPHQKEILGFSPRYSDGNTHDLQSPNFLTFKSAWERLSDFQLHVIERLQDLN